MSRRIEIELTSERDDGTWTWRAAGARQPKGVLDRSLLPSGVKVGDALKADVDQDLEGTTVRAIVAPKASRAEPERLELVGSGESGPLVTTQLVGKRGGSDRGDRRGGREGGDRRGTGPSDRGRPRGDRGRPGGDRGRPESAGDGRPPRNDRPRGEGRPGDDARTRRPRPPEDEKPRPKRLKPRRVHRRAVLDELAPEERPVAEQVLQGGIPAVRQAVEKQNEQARTEGRPEIDPSQLELLAEQLLPRLRAAEWKDRADAALHDLADLDLRDLRSVVVAAEVGAREPDAREMAGRLRTGLNERLEHDQTAWLAELTALLSDGRVVRALRVSSRPPKAGAPLPPDLATRLVDAATASLTDDTPADRWTTVVDALALSPVHARVAPTSVPTTTPEALAEAVAAVGDRVPLVAAALGVEPRPAGRRPRGPRRPGAGGAGAATGRGRPSDGGSKGPKARGTKPGGDAPIPPPPPPAGPPTAPPPSAPDEVATGQTQQGSETDRGEPASGDAESAPAP